MYNNIHRKMSLNKGLQTFVLYLHVTLKLIIPVLKTVKGKFWFENFFSENIGPFLPLWDKFYGQIDLIIATRTPSPQNLVPCRLESMKSLLAFCRRFVRLVEYQKPKNCEKFKKSKDCYKSLEYKQCGGKMSQTKNY